MRRELDRPFSLKVLDGSNRAYPDGDGSARGHVREHHSRFAHSLLWFLATDDDVPRHIRDEVCRWGLCADEFMGTDG